MCKDHRRSSFSREFSRIRLITTAKPYNQTARSNAVYRLRCSKRLLFEPVPCQIRALQTKSRFVCGLRAGAGHCRLASPLFRGAGRI
jgi:hypothetical protein